MEKFRFLEHTADAKFQAFGGTLEEAFHNAALATVALMWDLESIEPRVTYRIKAQGRDLKQLLCAFLEEIIFLLDTKSFLLGSVDDIKIEEKESFFTLKALFKGDIFSSKYKIFGEVKAITYDEMEIEGNDRFMIQVVVDI